MQRIIHKCACRNVRPRRSRRLTRRFFCFPSRTRTFNSPERGRLLRNVFGSVQLREERTFCVFHFATMDCIDQIGELISQIWHGGFAWTVQLWTRIDDMARRYPRFKAVCMKWRILTWKAVLMRRHSPIVTALEIIIAFILILQIRLMFQPQILHPEVTPMTIEIGAIVDCASPNDRARAINLLQATRQLFFFFFFFCNHLIALLIATSTYCANHRKIVYTYVTTLV